MTKIFVIRRLSYLFIVVAAVARAPDDAGPLLGVRSDEVNLWVVEDLVVLVRGELVHVELHHLVGRGDHRLWLQGVRAWGQEVRDSSGPDLFINDQSQNHVDIGVTRKLSISVSGKLR